MNLLTCCSGRGNSVESPEPFTIVLDPKGKKRDSFSMGNLTVINETPYERVVKWIKWDDEFELRARYSKYQEIFVWMQSAWIFSDRISKDRCQVTLLPNNLDQATREKRARNWVENTGSSEEDYPYYLEIQNAAFTISVLCKGQDITKETDPFGFDFPT